MPVEKGANSWLSSVATAAKNIALAATIETSDVVNQNAVLMPAISVNMLALESEIRDQVGGSTSTIHYVPDAALQSIFAAHPPVTTPSAQRMGFISDINLKTLVNSVLSEKHDA